MLQRLGVKFRHKSFGEGSLVKSVFSSFKQRTTVSFRKKKKMFSDGEEP